MNQLVGLLVGCILFFRALTYFLNKSLDTAEFIHQKQAIFSTQALDHCDTYLSGSTLFLSGSMWSGKVLGECFDRPLPSLHKENIIKKMFSRFYKLLFPER